jgi:hypothetical protein
MRSRERTGQRNRKASGAFLAPVNLCLPARGWHGKIKSWLCVIQSTLNAFRGAEDISGETS